MLRPRVTIPTIKKNPVTVNLEQLPIAVADISHTANGDLSVPALVAQAMKDIIRERPPTPPTSIQTYTPFVTEAAYSGVDTTLESKDNHILITPTVGGIQIKCDTILLPTATDIPIKIYLTGREADLNIEGQRCSVDVFSPDGYTKKLAIAKRDQYSIYLEVQEKGNQWYTSDPNEVIRFHIDSFFILK